MTAGRATLPSSRTSRPRPRSSASGTCSSPRATTRSRPASPTSSTASWLSGSAAPASPPRLSTALPPTRATWRSSPSTVTRRRRLSG
ncbi:hypothetical protein BN1708_019521 [Verticillium longisporum]|uniref:Uncharacterized protein n=1 Tax=Verticillium longisporum TaxID=100787 RepID=A0A0G4MJM4_VERLO|nr:hypothetical protein BN1708_019521 [Verticillium longisporum]